MLDNYSVPYVCIILFYVILSFVEYREILTKTTIRYILIITYFAFFGLSNNIGSDWFNYRDFYNNYNLYSSLKNSYEIGFSLLVRLFSSIGINYSVFKAFIVLFQVFLFDKIVIKYSSNISLCYVILISSFGIVIIDLLRNFTSILLATLALPLFIDKKYIKASGLCLLASFIHITGVLFIFIFYIFRKYIDTKILIALFIIGIIIYLLQIHYIKPLISGFGSLFGGRIGYLASLYVESAIQGSETKVYGIRIGIFEKLFFMSVFLYKRKTIIKSNKTMNLVGNLFVFYIFIYLYMSEMEAVINRFSVLFMFGYILIVTNIIFSFKLKSNFRIIYSIAIILFLLKTYTSFNNILYDYSNLMLKNDDIEQRIYNRSGYYINKN